MTGHAYQPRGAGRKHDSRSRDQGSRQRREDGALFLGGVLVKMMVVSGKLQAVA